MYDIPEAYHVSYIRGLCHSISLSDLLEELDKGWPNKLVHSGVLTKDDIMLLPDVFVLQRPVLKKLLETTRHHQHISRFQKYDASLPRKPRALPRRVAEYPRHWPRLMLMIVG